MLAFGVGYPEIPMRKTDWVGTVAGPNRFQFEQELSYRLGLPPTQDASHHQDYYIFSRESL